MPIEITLKMGPRTPQPNCASHLISCPIVLPDPSRPHTKPATVKYPIAEQILPRTSVIEGIFSHNGKKLRLPNAYRFRCLVGRRRLYTLLDPSEMRWLGVVREMLPVHNGSIQLR